jgi:ketosteroid isomerase-like protein
VSSNAQRADALVRVLRAAIANDAETIRALCVTDVRVWTPARTAASVDEVVKALAERDGVFSDIELETTPLDVAGDHACVEWIANMAEPTGVAVALHGVAIAEFDGERIASVRQYWDHAELFDQLGLVDQ